MTDEFLDQTRRVKARAKASSVLRARSDGASYEALAVKKQSFENVFAGTLKRDWRTGWPVERLLTGIEPARQHGAWTAGRSLPFW